MFTKIRFNLTTIFIFAFTVFFTSLLLPKNTFAQASNPTCDCGSLLGVSCYVINRCGDNLTENCSSDCSSCTCSPIATNTPMPLRWICNYPGVNQTYGTYGTYGSAKCQQASVDCPNPDKVGGACFTTEQNCIDGCILVTPGPLNLLAANNPLCSYAPGKYGIRSAIGCIPIDNTNQFLTFVLRWALGVGGGISFLLIVFSGFMIMSAGSNVEKLKAGRQLLTAAITGLILVIFSVFILDFIGLRILRLPGL